MKKKELKKIIDNITSNEVDFKNKIKWEDLSFIDTSCSSDDFTALEKKTILDFVNKLIESRIKEYYSGNKQAFTITTFEVLNVYAIVIFHPECEEEITYVPRLEVVITKKPSRTFIELDNHGVYDKYDSAFIKGDNEYECKQ